jgi:hypothetical protein
MDDPARGESPTSPAQQHIRIPRGQGSAAG